MEKPPHLTHEDVEALQQSIEEGKRRQALEQKANKEAKIAV